MQTEEEKKAKFKEWYEANKGRVSARRKQKYAEDPDYRQSTLDRAAEWRKTNPTPSRSGEARFRVIKGEQVEVFRIAEVSAMIGRSDQTIRDWEAAGTIPKPSIVSAHRYYTLRQVMQLRELCDLIDVARGEGKEVLNAAIKSKSKSIHKLWSR